MLVAAVALCGFSSADDNATTSTQDASQQPRPIDKGLEPLYVMTDTFLDIVHPQSRGSALNDPRFDEGMILLLC